MGLSLELFEIMFFKLTANQVVFDKIVGSLWARLLGNLLTYPKKLTKLWIFLV